MTKIRPKVAAICCVITSACGASTPPPCPPGHYVQEGRCINPQDAVEKYARCIVRDAYIRSGKTVTAKIDHAKAGATSAVDFKDKVEKSVESTRDRCVLLDISSRCFALANGDKEAPALPADCTTEVSK